MFDDFFIASTAISSFNNAALLNPFFFSVGLLMLPLLYIVFLYGYDIAIKFGWTNHNIENKTGFWNVCFLALWLVLFGGNYAVIRDGMSLLPLCNALILFLSMIVISNGVVQLKYLDKINDKKSKWLVLFGILLCAVLSSMMNWWGILLQISAIICGVIIGCRLRKDMSLIPLSTLIFGIVTVCVLMQPEYFRFGQLGNLTLIHLVCIMLTGFFAVTTLISKYVKPHGRIHYSAFIKLKWLLRIVSLLAAILFLATESVPVFLGLLMSVALLEALTIYHNAKISDVLFKQSWAWLMIFVGILVICPVISVIGVVYLAFFRNKEKIKGFNRLL